MIRPINQNPIIVNLMMVSIRGFRRDIVEVVNVAKSKLHGGHRHHIEDLCDSIEAIRGLIQDLSPLLIGKWVTVYVQSGSCSSQLLTTHEIRIVSKLFDVVCHRVHFMFNSILYVDRGQTTISALAKIMDYARRHHSNDPNRWSGMIEELKRS